MSTSSIDLHGLLDDCICLCVCVCRFYGKGLRGSWVAAVWAAKVCHVSTILGSEVGDIDTHLLEQPTTGSSEAGYTHHLPQLIIENK